MNPGGAVEEGAKVAGSLIDTFKREPWSLALVLMNLALLTFFWIILTTLAQQRERETALVYQDNKQVRELLAKCILPEDLQRLQQPPTP